MQILRMFSNDNYKGTRGYLDSQKKYEILRTMLFFGISLALFAAGIITTKTKVNLLTIVAVLGCLPASKSAVGMIMYLRYKSCSADTAEQIERHSQGLNVLYDLVFTSYDKNFAVAHITVKGNTICGYTDNSSFDEKAFYKHLESILRADGFRETSVKIFKDIRKYTDRLDQLQTLEADESNTSGIMDTLKSVSL